MDYEIIENVTYADVAVRVKGASYSELFTKSGQALMSEMVENLSDIVTETEKDGTISGGSIELLLFEFLNEFVFFKDAAGLLLLPAGVSVTEENGEFTCRYKLAGEKIDHERHIFRVDIKAVTMHGFTLFRESDIFIAEMVFDV